ncbi:MAG TPA: Ig-like domain-containing protein, partial [Bacillota bacterium]|nr:Ig-like domain-containing protein [Bacillota bacterium]
MIVGETQLLYITVIPIEVDDQTLSYASSDLEVARVNGIGRISAMAEGSTTITVSCGDISESFNLEVSSITEEPDTTIAVTDIELQDFNDELHVGETITLSPTVFPIDATDQSITYKSSDAAIATISPSGIIEGISGGKVTIYISAGDYTKEVPLNVKVKTSGIKVNRDYILLKPGKVFTLESRVVPSNASAKIIKYKSLDTQIATVSKNGLIEAIDNGYTSIIVSNDEISTVVTVIVDQHAQAENVPVDNGSSQEAIKIVYPHKVVVDELEYINENM